MAPTSRSFIFAAKDAQLFSSYRASAILQLLSIFIAVATYYFLGESVVAKLDGAYGDNYFAYVLSGLAIATFLTAATTSQANQLSQEMRGGTLEMILVAPANKLSLLATLSTWHYLFAAGVSLLYLLTARFVFALSFQSAALLSLVATLMLAFAIFFGIGMLASAFVLRFKRGNPAQWLAGGIQIFLGGVYFPIESLPYGLRHLAEWLPLAHCTHAFRAALLEGAGVEQLRNELGILALFATLFVCLGIYCLARQIAWVRRHGSFCDH